MSTPWLKRKARLRALLKTTADEDEAGRALDRILHGQNVIGKTAKTVEIDALRFQDADLQLVGTLERGQFGLIDIVKCHLDGCMYVRKSVERRFALRVREQCSPQFERDILLRARATGSVWAPHLLCAFQTPTHLSIVMTYAEGGSLWDVLESSPLNGGGAGSGGRVAEADMAWWAPQIVSAVGWCHEQGFAHRDIKPHNFVLTPAAHVLLIDFGSAAPLVGPERRVPKRHCLVPCGTCDYIAPEILQAHEQALVDLEMDFSTTTSSARNGEGNGGREGEEEEYGYGFEVDWWSTGAMLYEMVYGVAPFFAPDIRKTYLRIVEHEKSLRFDAGVQVSALFQDLLRRFLTHADRRLGREGIHEIHDHPAFVEVNWTTLSTETAPPALHLPQFTYAEPSMVLPSMEEDTSHSQGFAFSALFQSSPMSAAASPGAALHQATATPRRSTMSSNISLAPQDDAFIGFSWGPPDDVFPDVSFRDADRSSFDLSRQVDVDGMATPRPARLGAPVPVTATPNPRLRSVVHHPSTATPAPGFHSYPFLTPARAPHAAPPQTLPRSTVRRTAPGTARRAVSDREAMKQLADCVGMSARKKVLASGRKPRVLPAVPGLVGMGMGVGVAPAPPLPALAHSLSQRPQAHVQQQRRRSSTGTSAGTGTRRRGSLPPVAVPAFGESSQGQLYPARALAGSSEEEGRETETESEGPPSPSPSPRPGSAMSMLSRRSGTPTITGTFTSRSGVLGMGGASGSGVLGGASGSGASLSVPVLHSHSHSRTYHSRRGTEPEPEHVVVASPTWEDTTFDALEDKHAAMMEEIMMLEDRLDRFSASALVGSGRTR
ncbi:kinase-like domain-containing protein [Mycena galopus ATCC 62051]|nr:kinase-like domain-containing protein [Mycena galopus ATCC 62051]